MRLPDFLVADDGGFIHIAGHRIGFHHVIRLYNEGHSTEMIAAHYPSLPLAVVHKIIGFYLENKEDGDAYVAEHDREVQRHAAASRVAPTVSDLRARLDSRQRAEVKPAPTAAKP